MSTYCILLRFRDVKHFEQFIDLSQNDDRHEKNTVKCKQEPLIAFSDDTTTKQVNGTGM